MKRLDQEQLSNSHDRMCDISYGECTCLVWYVEELYREVDLLRKSLNEMLILVRQSEEYNDETCPRDVVDQVKAADAAMDQTRPL